MHKQQVCLLDRIIMMLKDDLRVNFKLGSGGQVVTVM